MPLGTSLHIVYATALNLCRVFDEPMTEINQTKPTMLSRYGSGILTIAHIVLPLGLLVQRFVFAEAFSVPLFNLRFSLFFGATLVWVVLALWGLQREFVQHRVIQMPLLSWLGAVGVSVGAFWVIQSEPSLETFALTLGSYLLATVVGLGCLVLAQFQMVVPWRSLRQAGLIVFLSIAVPLLLLEGALRVYFSAFGTEEQKAAYIYSVEDALAISNRYISQAYVNFMPSPNFAEHNERGYRGDSLAHPKQAQTFRIFALGGSTTYGTQIPPEVAYPAQLERILHDEYGYAHVEVVNAGVEVYTSYDSLASLLYRVLDDEPDMILIYHGINDVRARLVDPSRYSGLNAERGQWSTASLERRIPDSILLRFLGVQLGFVPNLLNTESIINATSQVPICGIAEVYCQRLDMAAVDVLAANPPIYFERNLRNMVAIARANGVRPVLSTWDYYPDDDFQYLNVMSQAHLQAGVAEQNALLLELAAELAVPIVNLDMPDIAEDWIDGMHMTATGTARQAAQYAAFLVENDLLPAP